MQSQPLGIEPRNHGFTVLWCDIRKKERERERGRKKEKEKVKSLTCVRLFETPWTVAHQAPPSVGFSRQEYWSGLPFPSHAKGAPARKTAFQAPLSRPPESGFQQEPQEMHVHITI